MNFGFDEEQTSLGDTVGQLLADHAGLLAPETGKGEQAAAEVVGRVLEAPVQARIPDIAEQPPGAIVLVTG